MSKPIARFVNADGGISFAVGFNPVGPFVVNVYDEGVHVEFTGTLKKADEFAGLREALTLAEEEFFAREKANIQNP